MKQVSYWQPTNIRRHRTKSNRHGARDYCIPASIFFFCGATAQRGPWPHSWGFYITVIGRTTLGGTPLEEWSARLRDLYLTTRRRDSITQSPQASGRRPTPLDRAVTGIDTASDILSTVLILHIQFSGHNRCVTAGSDWTEWAHDYFKWPALYRTSKVHYRIQNIPSRGHTLRQINLSTLFQPNSSSSILLSFQLRLKSSKRPFFSLPTKNLVWISLPPFVPHTQPISALLTLVLIYFNHSTKLSSLWNSAQKRNSNQSLITYYLLHKAESLRS